MITGKIRMKIYIVILFAAISLNVFAQVPRPREPNELSIYCGIGALSLAPISGFVNGFAFDLGVGYTYFFNKKWGIHFGIGPGLYNVKTSQNLNVLTPNITDRNNYRFDLHTATDYREHYNSLFLKVPVMLQYQKLQPTHWSKVQVRQGFYAMIGIKAIVPFSSRFESDNTSQTNLAYYPEFDNWAGTQTFAGLGDFAGSTLNNNLDIGTTIMLALEAGIKWRIRNNRSLYTGIYVDYGLSVAVHENRTTFNNHIAVEQLTAFPILEFPEKLNIVSVGVKLRLALFRLPQEGRCPY